jgi:hypothetical protein
VRADLAHGLANRLYESFYCAGTAVPVRGAGGAAAASVVPDPAVVAAISAANDGRGAWDRGWSLETFDDGALVVARDGVRVWARPSECHGDGPLHPGARVAIRLPPALSAISPGFVTLVGNADLAAERDDLLARV